MSGRRGLAIVNMLIYMVLFTILAGTLLTIVSSQTRLMERRIRQVKADYAAESAIVEYLDRIRRGVCNPAVANATTIAVPWTYRDPGQSDGDVTTRDVRVVYVPFAGINGTATISATFNSTY
jgi:Tfp pilus assembly protein PilX